MDYLAAIRRDSDRFYAAAREADPTAPVPSCPEWSVADLVWHLGEVHWFWGTDVERRASTPDELEQLKPPRPAEYDELVAWGQAQADRLIGLLEATSDHVAAWTWALEDADHNVGFIRRHQVQEAALHRWDIESAVGGRPHPIEPDVATDSIDEILAITLPWGVRPENPLPGRVRIRCTDTGRVWVIDVDGRVATAGGSDVEVSITGTAPGILLALYRRAPLDSLSIEGDAPYAEELLARIITE
jgi:uncharacterized protein (TIGR03083 family)